MSLGITHFAFGATVFFVASTYAELKTGRQMTHSLWLVVGGLFAMLPDIGKIGPSVLPHDGVLANVFLFHQLLDVLDTDDSLWLGAGALALLLYCVVSHAYEVKYGRG